MNDEPNTDFDFESAIDKIQQMMSTDDGQSQISDIVNAFMGSNNDSGENNCDEEGGFGNIFSNFDQMDTIIKIGSVLSSLKSSDNEKNIKLLYAIRPYLRPSRQEKTESAVKIMGMVKAFALLKDSDLDLGF